MPRIARLENTLRQYAWGSPTLISEYLGRPASGQPEAELWLGAHPSAPSRVDCDGAWRPLDALIAEDPAAWLGPRVAAACGNRLPFLLKILAAGQPLSLQAHPTRAQAQAGFADENARGVPLDAPHRNYKDDNHKPEVVCALSEFHALCGFKPHDRLAPFLRRLRVPAIAGDLQACLDEPGEASLRGLFGAIMRLDGANRDQLVAAVLAYARDHADDFAWQWIDRLDSFYPGDIGIAGAALLNVVRLAPGEALYQGAGFLHAYLQGIGVELMANSDNVLRGGLTPKHIDVPELLRTLTFEPTEPDLLHAAADGTYATPSREFELTRIDVDGHELARTPHSLEILICLGGCVALAAGEDTALELARGASAVVPAAAGAYRIHGEGLLFRATVPA